MRPVNPLWYLAALFIVIGGWMAATVVAAGAWDYVRDASLQGLDEPVDAHGATVAVFTDVRQPERQVRCTATPDGKDAKPVTIDDSPIDLRVTRDGSEWFLIGVLAEGRDDLSVRCAPKDKAADSASYRVGVAEGVDDRVRVGQAMTWIATLGGLALAAWTWWTRRTNRKES